jgi:hypothetical protein
MRVKGELVAVETPINIHNLSRTGFGVVSDIAFDAGETLDFKLTSADGTVASVTAEAVHTRPFPKTPGLYLTGFMFVPGQLTGLVPQASIDRLIESVTHHAPLLETIKNR